MKMVSGIYKSTLPYAWDTGNHNKREHRRLLKALKKAQRKKSKKVSALGWPMR